MKRQALLFLWCTTAVLLLIRFAPVAPAQFQPPALPGTFTDIPTPGTLPTAGKTAAYTKNGAVCGLSPSGVETCTGSVNTVTQISKVTLAAPAANITFTSIPATYNNLTLTLDGASATAATSDNVAIQLNADTGANYNFQQIFGEGNTGNTSAFGFSGVGIAGTANQGCGAVAAANAPANESGYLQISILNYAGTTFRKHLLCNSGNNIADSLGNLNSWQDFLTWKNTAAITSIKLTPVSGANFVTGTTAILYGVL